MDVEDFARYCDGFYGVDGIYADMFDGGVSFDVIRHAAYVVRHMSPMWDGGDSFDRERVRDVLLFAMKGVMV